MLTKKKIIQTIKDLSKAQGFYSGLYKFITEDSIESKEFLEHLENKNFKDSTELIFYFEK